MMPILAKEDLTKVIFLMIAIKIVTDARKGIFYIHMKKLKLTLYVDTECWEGIVGIAL